MARDTEQRTTFAGVDLQVALEDHLPTGPEVRARLFQAMRRVTGILRAEIIRELGASVRLRSGDLVAALEERVLTEGGTDRVTGAVSFNRRQAYKARFLEYGTAAHDIQARGATKALRARAYRRAARFGRPRPELAQALALQGVGGRIFRTRVHHPGLRARRFLQAAGQAATPSIVAAFQAAMRDLGSETAGVVASAGTRYGEI